MRHVLLDYPQSQKAHHPHRKDAHCQKQRACTYTNAACSCVEGSQKSHTRRTEDAHTGPLLVLRLICPPRTQSAPALCLSQVKTTVTGGLYTCPGLSANVKSPLPKRGLGSQRFSAIIGPECSHVVNDRQDLSWLPAQLASV